MRDVVGGGELEQGCLLNHGARSRRPPSEGADAACPNPSPSSGVARADRCRRETPLAGGGAGVQALSNLFPRCIANVGLNRQALTAARGQV